MAWHVGPPREHIDRGISNDFVRQWFLFLQREAADTNTRWRLDAYVTSVTSPVTIADTFIDEWLEGLWRAPKT